MLYKLIGDNPEIEGLRKTLDEKKTWDNLQKMKKYKKMMMKKMKKILTM